MTKDYERVGKKVSDNRRKICILHIAEAPEEVERYLVTLLTKLKQNYSDVFEQILVCSEAYDREKFKDLDDEIERVKEMQNDIQPVRDLKSKLPTTTSSGGLILALIRALTLLA